MVSIDDVRERWPTAAAAITGSASRSAFWPCCWRSAAWAAATPPRTPTAPTSMPPIPGRSSRPRTSAATTSGLAADELELMLLAQPELSSGSARGHRGQDRRLSRHGAALHHRSNDGRRPRRTVRQGQGSRRSATVALRKDPYFDWRRRCCRSPSCWPPWRS